MYAEGSKLKKRDLHKVKLILQVKKKNQPNRSQLTDMHARWNLAVMKNTDTVTSVQWLLPCIGAPITWWTSTTSPWPRQCWTTARALQTTFTFLVKSILIPIIHPWYSNSNFFRSRMDRGRYPHLRWRFNSPACRIQRAILRARAVRKGYSKSLEFRWHRRSLWPGILSGNHSPNLEALILSY